MAVIVRDRCLTIIMKNSLNTLPIFPNHVTRQVFSSAHSTSGTQRLDSIVLQVSKFHYTSISIPLLWKLLLKMQRDVMWLLNTRYICLWDHKRETSQYMKEKSENLNCKYCFEQHSNLITLGSKRFVHKNKSGLCTKL